MSRPGDPLTASLKPATALTGDPLARRQLARDSLAKLREQAEAPQLPPLGPGENAYVTDFGLPSYAVLTPEQAALYPPDKQQLMTPTHVEVFTPPAVAPAVDSPAAYALPPLGPKDNAYVTDFGLPTQAILSPEQAATYPPEQQQLMMPTRVGDPGPDDSSDVPPRPPTLRPLAPGDNAYISDVGILSPEEALMFPPEMQRNMMPTQANFKPPMPRKWYERWGEDIADSNIGADINRLTDDTWNRGDGDFLGDFGALVGDTALTGVEGAVEGTAAVIRKILSTMYKGLPQKVQDAIENAGALGGDIEKLMAWLADNAPYLMMATAAGALIYAATPLLTSGSRRARSD